MDFLQRSVTDIALYASVRMVQSTMPTVSVDSAIRRFIKEFGEICDGCTVESLRYRYLRMRDEYMELEKSKGDGNQEGQG